MSLVNLPLVFSPILSAVAVVVFIVFLLTVSVISDSIKKA